MDGGFKGKAEDETLDLNCDTCPWYASVSSLSFVQGSEKREFMVPNSPFKICKL